MLVLSLVLSSYDYTGCEDCYSEYLRMSSYYKNTNTEKIYMKYTAVSVVGGVYGEALTTELTQVDAKFRLNSGAHMTMYQDEQFQIIVSHDRKQIVVQKSRFSKKAAMDWDKLSASYHADTLKKYFTPIQCESQNGIGHLSMEVKQQFQSRSPIKQMAYDYEIKSGKMLKAIVDSEVEGSKRKEILTIEKFTSHNVAEPFKGTALSQVMVSEGKLKEAFKTYRLTDVR
jgi:hypothetical protein